MIQRGQIGSVRYLSRYPVKSMLGEDLDRASVDEAGLAGDRAFAVLDCLTGKVASAKNPRLWRDLLTLRATALSLGTGSLGTGSLGAGPLGAGSLGAGSLGAGSLGAGSLGAGSPGTGSRGAGSLGAGGPRGVRLTTADGVSETVTVGDVPDPRLSKLVGRDVRLIDRAAPGASVERLDPAGVTTEEDLLGTAMGSSALAACAPAGTFFDFAPLHLVTTATLANIAAFTGRPVDRWRLRPNIVVTVPEPGAGFVENDWPGRRLRIGSDLVVEVIVATPRCVVPVLRHGDGEPDVALLRVLNRHNRLPVAGPQPCAGVYARPVVPGVIRPGDPVEFC